MASNACQCVTTQDCAAHNPSDRCAGTLICDDSHQCEIDPGTVVKCGPATDECKVMACDPATGSCNPAPAADGTTCDDGDVCTSGDACLAGTCKAGKAAVCDSKNPCLQDACDPVKGRTTAPLTGPSCDDGDKCTTSDSCRNGACVGGATVECDSKNPCIKDSCAPGQGCVQDRLSGNDCQTDQCHLGEVCVDGDCKGGVTLTCAKKSDCTSTACDPATGCGYAPINEGLGCDDGNGCTVGETCDAQGRCTSTTTPCSPPACQVLAGCTVEGSPPAPNCKYKNADDNTACDDGMKCTVGDRCIQGACTPTGLRDCNDHDPCTSDAACSEAATTRDGCVHLPMQPGAACDTGDPCQPGVCIPDVFGGTMSCVPSAKDCDDHDPCSADTCDKATGNCVHTPGLDDGSACVKDPCIIGQSCLSGACQGGSARSCDDSNACTADTCDSSVTTGDPCVHANDDTASCSDGNSCTPNDRCSSGTCVADAAVSCQMPNPHCREAGGSVSCYCSTSMVFPISYFTCDRGLANTCGGLSGWLGDQCKCGSNAACTGDLACTTSYCKCTASPLPPYLLICKWVKGTVWACQDLANGCGIQ